MVSTIYKQVLRGQSNRDSFSGRANHIDFCPRYNSKEDNKMKEERMIDLLANTNTNIFEIHKHNCKDVLNKICISQPPARTIKVEYLDGEIEEIKRGDPNSIFKIFNCAKEDK